MWGAHLRSVVPERVALLFAYDGPLFDGYARQSDPGLHTVEDALMDALLEMGVRPSREALEWQTGSRTDRGVSARQNVVSFLSDVPPERVAVVAMGRVAGIWPLASVAVDPDFDPRWAVSRTYRYFLAGHRGPKWRARLEGAFALFEGTHDFGAFSKREEGRTPERTIRGTRIIDGEEGLIVEVVGRAFLWQQVRRMMAAALAVAEGQLDPEVVRERLRPGARPLDLAPAPAEALVLWEVVYPNVVFPEAAEVSPRQEGERVAAWSAAWARLSLARMVGAGKGTGPD